MATTETLSDVGNRAANGAIATGKKAQETLSDLPNKIKCCCSDMYTSTCNAAMAAKESLSDVGNRAANGAIATGKKAEETLTHVAQKTKDAAITAGNSVGSFATNLWQAVLDIIVDAFNAAQEVLGNLINKFKCYFGDMCAATSNAVIATKET